MKRKTRKRIIIAVLVAILLIPTTRMTVMAYMAFLYGTIESGGVSALLSSSTEDAAHIYLNNVEEEILDLFYADGGRMLFDEEAKESSTAWMEDGDVAGVYMNSTKTICVYDMPLGTSASIVVHELGHYIDQREERLSETSEFLEIAKKEIENYKVTQLLFEGTKQIYNEFANEGTAHEYFADAFMHYTLRPLYLKIVAPETYQYMKVLVERMAL